MKLRAILVLSLAACGHAATTPIPRSQYDALVAAPDRPEADRTLDAGRKPAEMLAFVEVAPGMKVAEIGAGRGYTSELLARAVGPTGVVYGQNSPDILKRFAEKPWSERLAQPVNKVIVRSDRDFDTPLPPEVHDLDLVVINFVYHDLVWMNVDRDKMNRAILAALKPGGAYVIIDSSARAGSGTADAQTLHRIDEQVVRDEVGRAGFRLAAEGEFLRNPADARDWNSSPGAAGERRGTGDRFALKFVKP